MENILLIVKYKIWPPSSKGIGNKLNKEIIREKAIKILIKPFKVSNLKLWAFLTIPIGPAKSFVIVLLLMEMKLDRK